MEYTLAGAAPAPASAAQRRKTYRAKAHAERRTYDKAQYLGRRFVGVDGEGLNVRSGKRKGAHDYVLLAASGHEPMLRKDGLKTGEILTYLWGNLDPKDINVIYGGSYDFNCWIADLPREDVERLYKNARKGVRLGPYTLRWLKGKWFKIKRDGKTITIHDIVSFFQKPFIDACDEYLGDYGGRDILVREKARRGDFTWREIAGIGRYNHLELDLLVELATELRRRLDDVGLRPRQWIGPGAIAAALFEREDVPAHMDKKVPEPVAEASRYAYAGGRFECLKYGIGDAAAWEYDLNSAYPKGLSLVPSLAGGLWAHSGRGTKVRPEAFALYRVRWTNTRHDAVPIPGPFFVRAKNGTISYPMTGENWIWAPEAANMTEYARLTGTTFTVLEAWTFTPGNSHKPFGFIPAMYELRKALKAAGDGAHVALKLALNSIYGKCAQQVGWDKKTRQAPKYHQLEWAGYVTAYCRAAVLRAAMQDLDAVIAFETDALFTSRPLDIPVSDRLGEWEETVFENLTYVQSGHYYGDKWEKGELKLVSKSRGVDRGELTRELVESAMFDGECKLKARLTRFMTAGIALAQGMHKWRRWETADKTLNLYPLGKRWPMPGDEQQRSGWNRTWTPPCEPVSRPYPVEWINPDPDMSELAELRETVQEWDD